MPCKWWKNIYALFCVCIIATVRKVEKKTQCECKNIFHVFVCVKAYLLMNPVLK